MCLTSHTSHWISLPCPSVAINRRLFHHRLFWKWISLKKIWYTKRMKLERNNPMLTVKIQCIENVIPFLLKMYLTAKDCNTKFQYIYWKRIGVKYISNTVFLCVFIAVIFQNVFIPHISGSHWTSERSKNIHVKCKLKVWLIVNYKIN